ncbi:MAG: hypothetical protein NC349_05800 [Paenibacillus sp.]|nr:hypothetical protein [Paenibacillus sp.]
MTNPSADNTNPTPDGDFRPKHRRSLLRRLLIITGCTILAVILIVTATITVAVSYLKPERLTPLVENYANEYLDARLSVDRIEISFWSTFPRFELDVQNLEVLTDAFSTLPDSVISALPAYADSLLSISRFQGAIDIPHLMAGKIALYDITVTSPRVNLVQATPEAWSLDIFPPSDSIPDDSDSPVIIPPVSFGTFEISGGFPVRYYSAPDSIDISVNLTTTRLQGDSAPVYSLSVEGLTSASVSGIIIKDLRAGIGGDINWSAKHPMRLGLDDFKLSIGQVEATVTSSIDFESDLRVETLRLGIPRTPFDHLIEIIPFSMRGELAKVSTDLSVAMDLNLTRPYAVGVDSIPSFNFKIDIPGGSLAYDGMRLDDFRLQADAVIDGDNLDRSAVSISRLMTRGEGMGFSLSANISDIISDPAVDGTFRGGLNVERLPMSLRNMISGDVKGILRADCNFNLRRSYLSHEKFHRIRLTGDATLSGLHADLPAIPASVYSNEIRFKLGTNTSFVYGQATADSLLTASLNIDTIACHYDGFDLNGRGLKMGIGTRNTASSSDTTIINPIGGHILAERFALRSQADSIRLHLRDASISGSLRRFHGEARRPQLDLKIATSGALYGDRINRAMLSKAEATMSVHPSTSPSAVRRRARIDSLMRLYPHLSYDSISAMSRAIARASRRQHRVDSITPATADDDRLGIEVDNSIKRVLRRWGAHGTLKADHMRMFTPLFPLRNRISGLNVELSTDSVVIHDTHITLGHSDFNIDGTISNITRALTSRNGSQPIKAMFNLTSDSINVNEIASAVFTGAAFADHFSGDMSFTAPLDENADENSLQSSVDMATASVDSTSVLIIPANIEATINVKANHITYSDLVFHDFHGTMNAFDGALNLARLGARSDVGAVNLNALYTAPTKHDATFAFGLTVDRLRIGQFLDLVPAVDTLMPMLQGINGVINADIAATTELDSMMNIDIPSLKAAIKISGDSLVVIDEETFRTIGKWLMFKNKAHNMIDSMTVEMIVDNSRMQMFPFVFNLDRYKLGVMGNNDMAMNFNYHVAVLKSPLPFKFGINISGNPDDMKIRLGKAKFNEKNMSKTVSIADTTRVNLVQQIRNVFRRGARNARINRIDFSSIKDAYMDVGDMKSDTISRSDSLYFIREGLIPAPDTIRPATTPSTDKKKQKKRQKKTT